MEIYDLAALKEDNQNVHHFPMAAFIISTTLIFIEDFTMVCHQQYYSINIDTGITMLEVLPAFPLTLGLIKTRMRYPQVFVGSADCGLRDIPKLG